MWKNFLRLKIRKLLKYWLRKIVQQEEIRMDSLEGVEMIAQIQTKILGMVLIGIKIREGVSPLLLYKKG